MLYTVYKIINKINGKYYIGKHQTEDLDDKYMGSGKLLKRAIKKYGLENFTKEILFVLETEQEMNDKEKELVEISNRSYNLCEGGKGGFGYIHQNKSITRKAYQTFKERHGCLSKMGQKYWKGRHLSNEHKERITLTKIGRPNGWLGRVHTEATKEKLRQSKNVGKKNPNFGKVWITNSIQNKCAYPEELELWFAQGYRRGRTLKKDIEIS